MIQAFWKKLWWILNINITFRNENMPKDFSTHVHRSFLVNSPKRNILNVHQLSNGYTNCSVSRHGVLLGNE